MEIDSILAQAGISLTDQHEEPVAGQEEPQSITMTDSDFDDILQNMGFQEEGERGEEEEDNTEEHDDGCDEGGDSDWRREEDAAVNGTDLDEEEDADWNRLEDAGIIQPAGTQQEDSQEETQPSEEFIPLNSPTFNMDDSTSRFSGAEWFNEIQKSRIILAGLGGIGSWAALLLARMVPATLCLYDDDVVEVANMSGQLYGSKDVGFHKADAMARMVAAYTSMSNLYAISEKFTAEKPAGDIMICGFDNMGARRLFFDKWWNHVHQLPEELRRKCLYIDGRLSLDTFQVLCITGDDESNMERYQKEFLFTSGEADSTVCSRKQTTYLASMIGSYMVNMFTNFIANSLNPIIPYSLPFFTEYSANYAIFKTEN